MAVGGRRVIAGVSGSVRSLGALRAGVAEARANEVPLLAVLAWVPAGGELAYRRAPCPILLRLWEQTARQRLQEAFDSAFGGVPPGVSVQGMVVRARPGPLLVQIADHPDDLLVVGYGGHGKLGAAVHGSVARYCMAHARCPVLAVPPPELITQVRSRPRRWRPEDFAVPLGGRRHGGPAASAAGRAVSVAEDRPPGSGPARHELPPAYRGAPYFQPRRPPLRQRALGRLRLMLVLTAAILLVVLTGVLLARGMP